MLGSEVSIVVLSLMDTLEISEDKRQDLNDHYDWSKAL